MGLLLRTKRLPIFRFAGRCFCAPLSAVRRTIAIAGLLLAWICANGAVWDVVQVFAWARMFAGYVHVLPVRAALSETFDSSKPCEFCIAVAKAKETEQKQTPQQIERSVEKLVLACEAPEKILIPPSACEWPADPLHFGVVRIEPVPVPPPRV